MKKLMHLLFLSCLKATELIEKKLHSDLSTVEHIQLRMHKMMCKACTNYEKQTIILEKGLEESFKNETSRIDVELLKKEIHKKLASGH